MIRFSTGELDDFKSMQEAHMMDTCLIAEPAKTADSNNIPIDGWDWNTAEESDCGIDTSPGKEMLDQVPSSTAVMRLPIDTVVSAQARVRVTYRFGIPETSPVTYNVIGTPRQGPSGLLVWLTNVTDGTDGG